MPSSQNYQIDQVVELISTINPKSVLDIGVGFGKYGFLTREYLDVNKDENVRDFKRVVDGIEIFESYLTPVHAFIYNQVFIGNALDIVPTLKKTYDLVLLIDVLEHFHYKDGLRLLKDLSKKSNLILISTPKFIGFQEDIFKNKHETHLHQWEENSYPKEYTLVFFDNRESRICLIGQEAPAISKKISLIRIRQKTGVYFPFLKSFGIFIASILNKFK